MVAQKVRCFDPYSTVPDFNSLNEVVKYMAEHEGNSCLNYANVADVCCRKIGMNTIRVDLWEEEEGKSIGHAILIAYDKPNEWHMFSNRNYGIIYSSDWCKAVTEYFNMAYAKVVIVKEHNQGSID